MTAPAANSETGFFEQVLQNLGVPQQFWTADIAALESVAHYEGPNQRFNPLNAVITEPGSTSFNSVGVQSYQNEAQGVAATTTLLQGSHWTGVVNSLKGGTEDQVVGAFDAAYTWSPGTHIPVLTGSALATQGASTVGSAAGASTATNTGFDWNPLDIPGEVAGGATSAAGSAVASGIETVLEALAKPFENFALVIFGGIVILVGLVLLAKSGSSGSSGGSSSGSTAFASGLGASAGSRRSSSSGSSSSSPAPASSSEPQNVTITRPSKPAPPRRNATVRSASSGRELPAADEAALAAG